MDSRNAALLAAAKSGDSLSVCEALDEGADINHRNQDGDTALILASSYGDFPDVVSELLVRGADERIKTNSGNLNGIRLDLDSNRGKTAFEWAQLENRHDVVRIFVNLENSENINKKMLKAAEEGKVRLVSGLLRAGADIETRDDYGDTGIHFSARRGHDNLVKMFLGQGVDVNIRGRWEGTVLMRAAALGQTKTVRLLLDSGAELNLQDSEGFTALMLAAKYDAAKIVCELIDRGADRDITNNDNKNALDYAKNDSPISLLLTRDNISVEDSEEIVNGKKALLIATKNGN